MKRILFAIGVLAMASMASAQDLRAQIDAFPIDPAIKSHFSYRGKPDKEWDFAPYQALFKTKTYGELRKALEELLKAVEKNPKAITSKAARNAFLTAKQSLLSLYYFYGDLHTTRGKSLV